MTLWRALVVLAGASSLGAQGTVRGYYMETHTVTTSTTAGGPKDVVSKTWTAGGRVRMTGFAPVTPMFPEGTFAIINDTGRILYYVSPSIRTIRQMMVGSIAQSMGVVSGGAARQYTLVGPGEDVLGHHTTIYEASAVHHLKMPMIGDTATREMRTSSRLWIATDTADPVLRAVVRQSPRSQAGLPPGVMLRSTGTTTTAGTLGVTTSTEVTALRLMDIDTAMFELPTGYTMINLSDELTAMRASVDSSMRAMEQMDPSFSADQRRRIDSLLGKADTTKRRKP